jgi:hypothetical protein
MYEYDDPGDPAAGRYLAPSGVCARNGTVSLNNSELQGYGKALRRNVVVHEVGHALGLGHSTSDQVMWDFVTTIQVPQGHDRADYRERWGPTRTCPALNDGGAACGGSLFGNLEPAPPLGLTPDLERVYDAVPDQIGATP